MDIRCDLDSLIATVDAKKRSQGDMRITNLGWFCNCVDENQWSTCTISLYKAFLAARRYLRTEFKCYLLDDHGGYLTLMIYVLWPFGRTSIKSITSLDSDLTNHSPTLFLSKS